MAKTKSDKLKAEKAELARMKAKAAKDKADKSKAEKAELARMKAAALAA